VAYHDRRPSLSCLSRFSKTFWSMIFDSLNKIVVLQLAVLAQVREAEKYVEASVIKGHWLASDFA
jgi:hypothetical protein